MKILVTGASGFIGRYLVPRLRSRNETVATDRRELDVLDPLLVRRTLLELRPDCVVHLAAATGRDLALDPFGVCALNVAATGELARLCAELGIRFVYSSSSEAYGDLDGRDCNEDSRLGRHHNLYGLTKYQGEQIASLYCRDPLIVRFTMPYGPGFPGSSMYPGPGKCALVNFLWAALHRQPITVHRDAARSWCWIDDLVEGFALLIEGEREGVYNIGRDDDLRTMHDVALLAYGLVGVRDQIEVVDPPGNVTPVKRISTARLQSEGWQPQVSLEDGMERTLRWLKTI